MTEYLLIVFLVGFGALTAVNHFGSVARQQTGNMAQELAGKHADMGGGPSSPGMPSGGSGGVGSGHPGDGGGAPGGGGPSGDPGGPDGGGGSPGPAPGQSGGGDPAGGGGGDAPGSGGVASEDQDMVFSQKGEDLLKGIEALRLKPYDDQTGETITEYVEGATIGYGHLITSKQEFKVYKDGITKEQAEKLFDEDVAPSVDKVNDVIEVSVNQHQFDAMVLLAFNIGNGKKGFAGSSVAKLVNDPEADTPYDSLEDAWKAWNKSQGEVNQGLINRRESEWNIYTDGVYERW